MRKLRKQILSLSSPSRNKLEWIMDQMSRGVGYRELSGHKLNTPDPADWISFPLKHRERAIVAMNKSGEYYLHSAGPHEAYNQYVGPKLRNRLNSPWK